jgi:hypothetical protein
MRRSAHRALVRSSAGCSRCEVMGFASIAAAPPPTATEHARRWAVPGAGPGVRTELRPGDGLRLGGLALRHEGLRQEVAAAHRWVSPPCACSDTARVPMRHPTAMHAGSRPSHSTPTAPHDDGSAMQGRAPGAAADAAG